jgi:hypothetical protein
MSRQWEEKMHKISKHRILGKGHGARIGTTRTQTETRTRAEETMMTVIFYRATLQRIQHDINQDNAEKIQNGDAPYISDSAIGGLITGFYSSEENERLCELLEEYRLEETQTNYWNIRREVIRQLNNLLYRDSVSLPNPKHKPNRAVRATPVPSDEYFSNTVIPVVVDGEEGRVYPTEAVPIQTVPTAQIIPQGQRAQTVTQEQPAQFITNGNGIGRGIKKGRFVKGSIEAKEHMAKLRAMRKK